MKEIQSVIYVDTTGNICILCSPLRLSARLRTNTRVHAGLWLISSRLF